MSEAEIRSTGESVGPQWRRIIMIDRQIGRVEVLGGHWIRQPQRLEVTV
jgi:hypothetical protein